ncbi:gliding motility lipoprotein GldH [Segetibacter sp. 3557_3]|uniref:gliding motility lipoprotein GldH n=1 Tax=Segetibacter sp. 3557_3 TaxID=2547429 RepID=UPI00105900CE|nr:gliding motility lipoprotein GldH [Segetibacter sp. 3557_3]TDH25131.1 gliding motility lipoprotein GldH [Segetibacter sp. 3557_3]
MKTVCILFCLFFLFSCDTIDLYEQTKAFRKHEWNSKEKVPISFEITDTVSLYNVFVVIRHTDAYNFNNIWLNLTTVAPGDTAVTRRLDLKLGDNQKGWLGSGMDDIFEHRILVSRNPDPTVSGIVLKKGRYQFILEQTMREDPLQHVMNAGIRLEKVK